MAESSPADGIAPSARTQKRVSLLTLTLMGVAPVVIYSWDPLHSQMHLFDSAEACAQGSGLDLTTCEALESEARSRGLTQAPSYAHLSACEAEFSRIHPACDGNQWCGAESVIGCRVGEDGLARPEASGFMVGDALIGRLGGEPGESLAEPDESQLQPVYGMAEQNLNGTSSYAAGWHYFTARGHHLGPGRDSRQVRLHHHFLNAGTGSHFDRRFDASRLPDRFSASRSSGVRGGFGGTARQSMVRATG